MEFLVGIGVTLQDFKDKLIARNKEVFGNIFKRKRKLEGQLDRLEAKAESNPSSPLVP